MALAKKYWWVIAIVFLLIFLFLSSKPSSSSNTSNSSGSNNENNGDSGSESGGSQYNSCEPISKMSWQNKKTWYWQRNGNDWGLAHDQMLKEGFCEWDT